MKKIPTDWDLSALYQSDDDPKMHEEMNTIEKKNQEFVQKWKSRTDFLEDPEVLREALDDYENWYHHYEGGGAVWYYFHLREERDQADAKIRAKNTQIRDFKNKITNEMRFFYLRLSKTPVENQKKLLNSKKLIKYKHYLERIFAESKYLLSEEEERIINLKSAPAYGNWVKMTSTFLSKEEHKILLEDGSHAAKSFSDILSLSESKNKKVREGAAGKINEILEKYADVATEELNSILENKKVDDSLRRIPRPDYIRHLYDDIDTSIVDTLIESVSKRFNIAFKYYELKAKLFGVKKLKYYERNVPYGEADKDYSYKEAAVLINKVLKNMDVDFSRIFSDFVQKGQIDVYPKKGKRSGAFCAGHLISEPTYILLNYANKLDDVLTIAHEVGHGINSELIKNKHHALYFGTPLSTAEVASTFMEDFVLQDILKEADDALRLEIMMMKLNSDISTIFRQAACYQFEQKIHADYRQSGYLSKETINKIFQEQMKAYMGPHVEQSPGSENWWVYWMHIRYFFYVYSYASGLLISKSLQNIVKNNPSAIIKVKEFLSAGLSESPKDTFLRLNINIADKKFWDQGLNEIEKLLNETTDLAKKLKKI